ncbi:MAG: hypothetical protein ABJL54_07415 [Halioglobus sp.]
MKANLIAMVLTLVCFGVQPAFSDALMQSQALKASNIIQYFIDEQGVRVELEIGMESLDKFKNLLPQEIYQGLGYGDRAFDERLQEFLTKDLAISVEGSPLKGRLLEIGPSQRVLRDPINGTPLPIQDTAPQVVRAVLMYTFKQEQLPQALMFTAPRSGNIGFVVYHKGIAVNDYRYLASGYVLTLDWTDPWYSGFNTRSLARKYSAPMSGFIYVENFEVRKEIIVRPKDLQDWVDLGLEGRDSIPIELQAEIKQKVGEFLAQHQPVTIDGEPVQGILESVNFLERTLTSSRVIDPPETLSLDAAVMGTIFVYPRQGLPESVVMDWDLWNARIQSIPVSAVDQAGPMANFLDPEWRQLEWTNFLKNPIVPTLNVVEAPIASWRVILHKLLPLFLALSVATVLWLLINIRAHRSRGMPAYLAVLFVGASLAALQLGGTNKPNVDRANAIVGDLLHNIYRAFDYREESDIYDVLATSVSGELLTDIFLETKRSLVLANQGGAEAKVKNVSLESIEIQPDSSQGSFNVKADWTVHGSVGHWGHIHKRSNRYLAELTVAVDGGQWKLQQMSVLQEERL